MATDVILLHFNNYFNRQVKHPGDKLEHYTALDSNYLTVRLVNFNEADGVETSLVIGKGETQLANKHLDSFDYLLVVNPDDINYPVLSRWFIIDRDRTRDGQYTLSLRRDVVVDNLTAVTSSPIFIEKGIISDVTDPLLYNKEDMTYNQIKESETLLKDATGCGWVVGYVPQNWPKDGSGNPSTETIVKDIPVLSGSYDEHSSTGMSTWLYYSATNLAGASRQVWTSFNDTVPQIVLKTKEEWGTAVKKANIETTVNKNGTITDTEVSYSLTSGVYIKGPVATGYVPRVKDAVTNLPGDSTLWGYAEDYLKELGMWGTPTYHTQTLIEQLKALDNKIYYDDPNGIYYRIKVVPVRAANVDYLISDNAKAADVKNRINSELVRSLSNSTNVTGNYNFDDIKVGYNNYGYVLEMEQLQESVKIVIDQNRNHVADAAYDIFCIPFSDTKQLKLDNSHTVTCNKNTALAVATAIGEKSGSGSMFDLQILPFCPAQEVINKNPTAYQTENAIIDVSSLSKDDITDSAGTEYLGAIIWCTSSIRSFDIDVSFGASADAVERKVENECDMYRLCSGNYQGMFEFSVAKSGGVTGFRADCTFKPYNPYIHVIPKLGGLYGENFADYKDARGLICGGDFSLTQLNDAWATFELQNKNYQNIFDRQIQNMDINNKLNKTEAIVSAIAGVGSGAISGATAGGMLGMGLGSAGIGAGVGGAIGGLASIAGGIADVELLKKRQQEARSYAIDMYGYNLGNIQALPSSLAKNTSLTANTKIFPFVEKYSSTDAEKEILRNKITYDGMTIMKIGTISGMSGFVRGQVIRLLNFKDDAHMANAIYEEIRKGVYL